MLEIYAMMKIYVLNLHVLDVNILHEYSLNEQLVFAL